MKIINAVYRINTVDMRDTKENIKELYEKFGTYITDIKLTNAPADAPLNIPRIICNDKNKLFNIVITNQSIEIQALKAENANDEVLLTEMINVVDKIGTAFEDYSDAPFNFCGFSIQVKATTEEIQENPTDFVSDRIQGMNSDLLVDNAMVRKCFIQGDYYINITMRNDKQMKVTAPKQVLNLLSLKLLMNSFYVKLMLMINMHSYTSQNITVKLNKQLVLLKMFLTSIEISY